MKGIFAFAVFCEDIRRESAGRDTIIGTMPETIQVPRFPGVLKRLSLYCRIRLSAKGKYTKAISVDLEIPGAAEGEVINENKDPIPQELIETSLKRARERGLPYATIIGRVQLQEPVPIAGPKQLLAILKYGDEREICGILNIVARPKDASTASPQPASQSPPAASKS